MLPEALSNRACSLVPGEDRFAVTVELEFDGAKVRRTAFHRSLIRSDARLDYPQVDRILAGDERAQDPWAAPLAAARKVAGALAEAREARGALAVESSEPEFGFSREGHVEALLPSEQTESHRLIEFLMIAANEAVASLLEARKLPALFRVHEPPDPPRVERLLGQLAALGVPTPRGRRAPDPRAGGRGGLRGRAARRRRGPPSRPRARRVHLARAAVVEAGALLAAQRRPLRPALAALLPLHLADPPLPGPDLPPRAAERDRRRRGDGARVRLPAAGEWCSARERDAMAIERTADNVARAFLLERRLFEERALQREFEGEVTGVIGAGAFIAFDGYEGMLPVRRLGDWYELDEHEVMLIGASGKRIRLGDPVRVQVASIDAVRGRVDLAPVEV